MYISTTKSYASNSLTSKIDQNTMSRGNTLPENSQSDSVNISQSAKSYLQQTHTTNSASNTGPVLKTGKELIMDLGTMALGGEKQLADWKDQGLEISYSTIKAAFQAFQNAFSEQIKEDSGPGGLIINRHEIVKNSQPVPEWFEQEYKSSLASMENIEAKQAFEEGALYYPAKLNPAVNKALSAYQTT